MVAVSPSEDSVQQAVSQSSVMPSTPKTPSVPETTLANLISIGSLDCGGFRNPLGLNETSSEVAECQDDHCQSEEVLVDISSSSSAPMKVRLAELNRQEQNVVWLTEMLWHFIHEILLKVLLININTVNILGSVSHSCVRQATLFHFITKKCILSRFKM